MAELFVVVIVACAACAGPTEDPPADDQKCSSGEFWQSGDSGSQRMHPGGNCIECHESGGPRFDIAGTVMGAFDDETDCNGVPDVLIEIIDKNGVVAITLTSNEAGNFYVSNGLSDDELPYTVRLTSDNGTREMPMAQTEQNCASCHTAQGSGGAPGRIVAP